jgi:hypothetical protein
VVDEFNAIGMSDYNWREPLYWITGKILTELMNDPWAAIIGLDAISAIAVAYAVRGNRRPGIAILAFVLSPMILLGLVNIHRQMVGFAIWMLIERITQGRTSLSTAPWHIIPLMIHSSMGVLSFVYFLAKAVRQKDIVVIFSMSAAIFIAFGVFGETLFQFFRQGTDTSTTIGGYLAWAGLVFPFILLGVGDKNGLVTFYVLGCIAATVLFIVSGGSSGSRFFMLVITTCTVWAFTTAELRLKEGLANTFFIFGLAVALVVPSLVSAFSIEILRAAVLRVPYGASI